MVTVYKIELVSDWINYSEVELKKLLKDTLIKNERNRGNTITVNIKKLIENIEKGMNWKFCYKEAKKL